MLAMTDWAVDLRVVGRSDMVFIRSSRSRVKRGCDLGYEEAIRHLLIPGQGSKDVNCGDTAARSYLQLPLPHLSAIRKMHKINADHSM